MSDVRESFPTLEDGSAVGTALRSVQEGDSVASKNGSIGFAFKDVSGNAVAAPVKSSGGAPGTAVPGLVAKDTAGNLIEVPVKASGDAPASAVPVLAFRNSAGNLTYPQLTSSGKLPVTLENTGTGVNARGKISGNVSLTTVCTASLSASVYYTELDFIVSCSRDALFQVIQNDNGSETILSEAMVGSGSMSFAGHLGGLEIATGGAGTQSLIIKAQNLNALSDLHASLTIRTL